MKVDKVQIRNWFISISLLILSFVLIITKTQDIPLVGILIDNTYIYYSDILLIIFAFIVFIYIIASKYYLIINIDRYNKNSFHALVNILMLPFLIITTLVFVDSINPIVGMIAILVQVLFTILIVVIKQENDKYQVDNFRLVMQLVLLLILLVSTLLSNLPFSIFYIPLNIICVVAYIYLTIVDIYQGFKIFSI